MRFWISGPRVLGYRPGVSFGPEDLRRIRASAPAAAAAPTARPSAFVYVVTATSGHVKIGVTADPIGRLASLQTGASEPLELVYACAVQSGDGYAIEQAAHSILWKHRLNGEWFDTTPAIAVAAVAAAAHALGDPIVEIKKDKIAYVIQEAARRAAAEAASPLPPRRSMARKTFYFMLAFTGILCAAPVIAGNTQLTGPQAAVVAGILGGVCLVMSAVISLCVGLATAWR